MTLFVTYFSVVVAESQDQAIEIQEQLQARLDQQATLATLLYLASTRPMSYAGLRTEPYHQVVVDNLFMAGDPYLPSGDELRLDGRRYQGLGNVTFRLQDAGSLISVRGDTFPRLKKLLALNEIDRMKQERLIGNLVDYSDRDSLSNLNGAEFRQYITEGMIRPLNRFLVSPMQLVNVLGWNTTLSTEQLHRILPEISIYVAGRENFNTMTRQGMRTIGFDGMDDDVIDVILAERRTTSFSDVAQVNLLTGSLIPYDSFASPLRPSKYLRVSLEQIGRRQEEWVGITLTPNSETTPWQIDYRLTLDTSATRSHDDATDTVENPATSLFH